MKILLGISNLHLALLTRDKDLILGFEYFLPISAFNLNPLQHPKYHAKPPKVRPFYPLPSQTLLKIPIPPGDGGSEGNLTADGTFEAAKHKVASTSVTWDEVLLSEAIVKHGEAHTSQKGTAGKAWNSLDGW